jgi:hypothetical protein
MKKLIALFSGWQFHANNHQKTQQPTKEKKKKNENKNKNKKKESGHMYSHPKSMAKGLTLP